MKEFWGETRKFDLKVIFISPTQNNVLQFFRYAFVGGVATIVDMGFLFILTDIIHIYHLVSAVIAFIFGLITNFVLSKLLVFNQNEARVNLFTEFVSYSVIGVIGLGFTELIMFLITDCLNQHYLLSKIIAAVVVLAWNYLARRFFLYKK